MSDRAQRRLAAIVAADVAGYSRLVGADEEGTLAALRAHRADLIDPLLAEHGGRVANTAGDSLLLEFPSIVDAVRCSVAVQKGMSQRNREIEQDRQIHFRVGIHLGDVIVDGNDLLGDGVNVAARLEGLCGPGGVVLSDDAYRQVRDRLDLDWTDDGEHEVKNIARPVQVWRWTAAQATPTPATPAPRMVTDKPSIAVLAFTNMSGDPEQEYFSDGIAEDIITELSRLPSLFVIARNSSFTYKGRAVDIRQVAKELGVRYVLEGSVRKVGSRVRITGQLIDASTGGHIWANRFDGDLDDVFELQDRVTESVIGAIQPKLQKAEIERSRRKRPQDLSAYDFVMRAMPHVWSLDRDDNTEALSLLSQAIEVDSNYGVALSLAAWCHGQQVTYNWSDNLEKSRSQANNLASRAVVISHDDPLALTAIGAAYSTIGDRKSAETFLERAVLLDPNSAWAWSRLGWSRTYAERPRDAIEYFQRALRLSPYDPMIFNWHVGLGSAYTMANEFDRAIEFFELALKERPKAVWMYRRLVPALWMAGRREDAKEGVRRLLLAYPDLTAEKVRRALPFTPEHNAWNCELLVKAGMPK